MPRVALAGGGDDDRLVGVVIPGEDGDPADVDAGGRAEVGERNPGRARGAGREEVGRLPDAAAGAGGVDRVARGVGRVDGQAGDLARGSPPGVLELPPIDAGPTAVHAWLDRASAWLSVKMRKLAVTSSLPGSPRPEVGSGFWKVSDQLVSVPVPPVVELFVMVNTQVPCTFMPLARREYGGQDCCGLNVAKNGALPFWIGVAALSSKTVLLKLAVVVPAPTPLKSVTWPRLTLPGP